MNQYVDSVDYRRIEKAIGYLREHQQEQPSLEEVAMHVHLSPSHFQRLFTEWAGVSPKKFLQYLTLRFAREELAKEQSLEAVAYHAGLSGSGRLHDLFVKLEGMTPGKYREKGSGLQIYYGIHPSPFGDYLLAITSQDSICSLQFLGVNEDPLPLLQSWSAAQLIPDGERTGKVAFKLFGTAPPESLRILARGTPFQLKVWEALLRIPAGNRVTYQNMAAAINNPRALQAVGSAIGSNPVAWLIPCHRVIRKNGQISEYRWGSPRKAAMLGWEAAQKSLSCN